jgi:hypothetical protein
VSPTGYLGILGGVGVSGASEQLVAALEFPVELRLEVDLGPRARIGLFARESFTPFEPARSFGVTGLGELAFGIRARLGNGWGYREGALGSGTFFGFERREVARTSMFGFVLGTEIDASYGEREERRRRRRGR